MSQENKKIGAVLVVGAGISGMQSALDLAESGFKVYLLDSSPAIGGRMAQLDKTFPTGDCAMCIMSPKLVECGRHLNIELMTYTDVKDIQGEPGNFKVKILKKPRYVDLTKCNGCGECSPVCPVEVNSEFNAELGKRKAIYRLYPQAVPNVFVIDKRGVPPCRYTCPAGVNAQGYIALISQGKFKEALELERADNPFPSVCGRVCTHPCEKECSRKDVDEPISIRTLKRFIADWEMKQPPPPVPPAFSKNKESTGERGKEEVKVAVVGAGPAGLSAAFQLVRFGYPVTVFETLPQAGGMLKFGIPEYRLPAHIIDYDIAYIQSLGVEIKLNTPVNNLEELKDYKAIFIAIGAQKSARMNVPGEDLLGVIPALDFLKNIKLSEKIAVGDRVAVVGGGSTAVDAARSAWRLGAKSVSILYRRSRQEMPADPSEVEEAELEGVEIKFLVSPKRIIGEGGRLKALECQRMELGAPDESGRRRPIPIAGSEFIIELDTIIPAIGQTPEASTLSKEINLTKWGTIVTDDLTKETNLKGVFAGGDVVLGAATVIEAIAAGKEVAISIDRYLRGIDLRERREKGERIKEIKKEGVPKKPRTKIRTLPLNERQRNFAEVELGLSEEEAIQEAKRCLNCSICSECKECEKVCAPKAINHEMKEQLAEIDVGVVILSPGFQLFDAQLKGEYGFGIYDNVTSSLQFERMLSASGPTEGEICRPSDKNLPKKIAFIQCVGSRDLVCGNEYCSSVCCMYSTKQAIVAKEHLEDIEPTIFFIDIRAFGKDFDRYYERAKEEYGIKYQRCMISKIVELPRTKNLRIKYITEDNKYKEEEFDLVVLAAGITALPEVKSLGENLKINLNDYGFCGTAGFSPSESSRKGIFVSGTFREPKDIPETVVDASSAAARASQMLAEVRGSMIRKKIYPPELDVSDEPLRMGVFVCDCGRNIAATVDVPNVVEYAKTLWDVACAEEFMFTCSQDSLEKIKQKIEEHKLNRVVVASCSPRILGPLFQDTIREAGLNPYLFEMANIREHCSWVHMKEKEKATAKAKGLVRIATAKARRLRPISRPYFELNHKALVIGGGLAGMTASLSLAQQGFEVHLIEKEEELGGNLRKLYYTLDASRPQELMQNMIEQVDRHELIHVYKSSEISEISGYVGNFKTTVNLIKGERQEELEHGILILATGASEYQPKEYLYGETPKVLTQTEFEERLAAGDEEIPKWENIVMIQCVGSRDEERPYCSRVCCAHAIKNALKIKELHPKSNVFILYRDIRTYGFKEKYYQEARSKGIIFVRYDPERKPEVKREGETLKVEIIDPILQEKLVLNPDLLVLSTGIVPIDENEKLSKILKVPLTSDKFFLEAHVKLRPIDFSTDGMYLCGLAHSPRFIEECITQATAASIRAATILSKEKIEAKAEVVTVKEKWCAGCGICVLVCPYEARVIDEETHVAKVLEVLCQGCGACVSACPSGASEQKGFEKRQVLDMMEASLV